MRCVQCIHFIVLGEFIKFGIDDDTETHCIVYGDTTEPTRDIFCGEAGDTEAEFVVENNLLYGIIDEVRT